MIWESPGVAETLVGGEGSAGTGVALASALASGLAALVGGLGLRLFGRRRRVLA